MAIGERTLIILLVFGCRLVQTILRMAMGALVIYICESYTCDAAWKGYLLSAHAFGYCTTQIIGGQIADRIGGQRVVYVSMLVSGIALASTSIAAARLGLVGIAITQVIMGIATGPLFPASTQLLARKLPASERAVASTTLDTGITVGSLIVVPLSAKLAVWIGWESTLILYGSLAMGYSFVWNFCVVDDQSSQVGAAKKVDDKASVEKKASVPTKRSESPRPSLEAKDTAKGGDDKKATPSKSGFAGVLEGVRYARLWAIYLSHFTFNYGIYFINSWSATFYLEMFSLRPEQAGLHLSLPHGLNLLVKMIVNPALEGFLRKRGVSDVGCRRTFTCLGFAVSAFFMAAAPLMSRFFSGPYAVTVCISIALGFAALHPSGFKANYMDVTRAHSGVVSGIGNTIASLASSIGPIAVAKMKDSTGSWAPAFGSVAGLNILAMLIFLTMSSATPFEVDAAASARKDK